MMRNIPIVARREFSVRVRTRSFLFGTLALVIGVALIAFVPVIVQLLDRGASERIAVYSPVDVRPDPVATLSSALNVRLATGTATAPPKDRYVVTRVESLDAARTDVTHGVHAAVLGMERGANGDLEFTLYTNGNATGRTAQLLQQASAAITIGDRLSRSGIAPGDQAALFSPPAFAVRWPDPTRAGTPLDSTEFGARYLLGFGMTILIFLMVVLYGNWVAMSVVEEKSSRVMEVVLNAASPLQLLTGKVLGVGAVALTQYVALLCTGITALLLQGPVAAAVLGEVNPAVALPEGLSIGILVLFGVYGVLGFLLYAVLYAAAGSMVSRQEDVQAAVMPLALISTAGYMVATYGSTGLLDSRAGWLVVLSQFPFVSPFMMLSRASSGEASIVEILVSIALLVVTIAGALLVASRMYAAGVLLYGQRPGLRAVWRIVRGAA